MNRDQRMHKLKSGSETAIWAANEIARLELELEHLRELAKPAIRLMRATGEFSGWHEKADELEAVINQKTL